MIQLKTWQRLYIYIIQGKPGAQGIPGRDGINGGPGEPGKDGEPAINGLPGEDVSILIFDTSADIYM